MPVSKAVDQFCNQLRQRTIEGSMPCAKRTAEILRVLVTQQKFTDAQSVIDEVRFVGGKIQASKPVELAIGNIVRRVLHLIREEQEVTESTEMATASTEQLMSHQTQQPEGPPGKSSLLSQALRTVPVGRGFTNRNVSLSNLLDVGIEDMEQLMAKGGGLASPRAAGASAPAAAVPASTTDGSTEEKRTSAKWVGKLQVIEAINELIDELENMQSSITVQGVEHIHANEVILTFGMSDTTYLFLKEASKKREFQVIVAEGAPDYGGHKMGRKLAEAGIQTTIITDSAVFAMMARANKVLVGAHAVLANGGVIAPVGIHLVALAAKKHSIPFVVLVGLHKLSPLFPHDPDVTYNEFKSPSAIVDLDVLAEAYGSLAEDGEKQLSVGGAAPAAPYPQRCRNAAMSDPFTSAGGTLLHAPNPAFDYIPPHLVSLFVTDTGGHTPSYVYRLLTEYYSREDYLLSKQLGT